MQKEKEKESGMDQTKPSQSGLDVWNSFAQDDIEYYIDHPYVWGPHASVTQHNDPKHNLFTLARYKFCAKMLVGKKRLLEVGCGDGLGLDIVRHEVKPEAITCVDFDDRVIRDNKKRCAECKGVEFLTRDMTQETLPGVYDGAWCVDVIEHVCPEGETSFLDNIVNVLNRHGVFLLGTPNVTAHSYASERSQAGHINLKDAESLRTIMAERFFNVFMFSMNDEVVHTGFSPMAHYLFALGVGVR